MILKNKLPRLDSVEAMYSDKLHELSMFAGGFINFGYWKNSKNTLGSLTIEDRLESQRDLYRLVAKRLSVSTESLILEVGCGIGVGTALLKKEYFPRKIIGLDSSTDQIRRAKRVNKAIDFVVGDSAKLPFPKQSFSHIMTIEAAQHFSLLAAFFSEAFRVLKPGGMLGVATFFGKDESKLDLATKLIPTIRNGVDRLTNISRVVKDLENVGFSEICTTPIGEYVWRFLDDWVSQSDLKSSWDRNWYKGFIEGAFDYYLIVAKKYEKTKPQ